LWLAAERALDGSQLKEAQKRLDSLLGLGKDGYTVQMALARISHAKGDRDGMRKALEAAHRFDPSQAEPLGSLVRLARAAGQKDPELAALRKLAAVDQHDPEVYRSLMRLLIDAGNFEEAVKVGEAAVHLDMEGFDSHELYGRALEARGLLEKAAFELETAVLCPAKPQQLADAHRRLSSVFGRLGQAGKARVHADSAASAETQGANP
jgi:Flp pilus assembly protein TadD